MLKIGLFEHTFKQNSGCFVIIRFAFEAHRGHDLLKICINKWSAFGPILINLGPNLTFGSTAK